MNRKASFNAILSTLGLAVGLLVAIVRGSGFWGYVGYAFIFSIIGGLVGLTLDEMTGNSHEQTEEGAAK